MIDRAHFAQKLFLLLTTFVLAACTSTPPASIRVGMANMPVNLDPRFTTDAAATRVGRLIFQRLVEFDAQRKPIPGLASWQTLSPTHYRFILQGESTLRFHDGTPLTSYDVKSTYDQVLDAKTASPHRATLSLIKLIETPDERTIDFQLNRVDPLFPAYLVVGIISRKHIQENHNIDRDPIGSGPFRFEKRPDETRLVLRRISDNQIVEFVHVPNPTVRVLKLLRGEIDLVQNDLPPELVRYMGTQEHVSVQRAEGSNFAYLGMNFRDPLLAIPEVRQAIAHAIDRKAIVQYLFGDMARIANTLLPPDHWASRADLEGYDYNPEKTKQLLKKVGVDPSSIHLSYKTSSDPFRIRVATILQQQLAQAGIRVDVRSYDWGTFYGDIKNGRFQIYSLAWIGIKTPDIFRYALHSQSIPPTGANRGYFSNADIDHMIEIAESQASIEQQANHYQQLQFSLLQLLPYIPLWYENHIAIARNNIQGYKIINDGSYDGLLNTQKSHL